MKTITNLILAFVLMTAVAVSGFGQTTTTQTTLNGAVASTTALTFTLTSVTGVSASTNTQEYDIVVDREQMKVQTVNTTLKTVTVTRGVAGIVSAHATGAVVYFGPSGPTPFVKQDPAGGASCTATAYLYLPIINPASGRVWNCIASTWMRDDGLVILPPTDCNSSVSGNSTGTNGFTTSGASVLPVVQAQTSNSGTNTHTYICNLSTVLSRLNLRGVYLRDAVFLYGVQTTGLGTQVATLASGTMNSAIVFSSITYPAAAASETASTVTPVRADAGSLVIAPVVGSANVATTTAGAFYSMKFTPATPFSMLTDLKQYLLTVALLNTATSATVTNSPGVIVHFAYLPD